MSRVEIDLKAAIAEKWGVIFLPADPYVTGLAGCIGRISNAAGNFDALDLVPLDQLEAGVRACFGLEPPDDIYGPLEEFYAAAQDYFDITYEQVLQAEPGSGSGFDKPFKVSITSSATLDKY